jgi:hypothetical protein
VTALWTGNPSKWGLEKQYILRAWLPGYVAKSHRPAAHPEIWTNIVAMAAKIFPGADACAFMGFCANGESLAANTTESVPKQEFHEMGIFGTEGGLRDKPAPDPNPKGRYCSWAALADDVDVRALLGGKSATMVPNAWKHEADDQCAVGLVNIRRHARSVFAALDPRIGPASDGSLWFTAVGFMAWSAGGPGATSHIKPHVEALAAVPENQRWGALMVEISKTHPHGFRHLNAAYSIARTAQKLEAGRMLQEDIGPVCNAWFDERLINADRAELFETIAKLGYPS